MNELLKNQEKANEMLVAINERSQAILSNTVEIKSLQAETMTLIVKTGQLMMKSLFEATEVKSPTCFIITPHDKDFYKNGGKEVSKEKEKEKVLLVDSFVKIHLEHLR